MKLWLYGYNASRLVESWLARGWAAGCEPCFHFGVDALEVTIPDPPAEREVYLARYRIPAHEAEVWIDYT